MPECDKLIGCYEKGNWFYNRSLFENVVNFLIKIEEIWLRWICQKKKK